MGGVSVKETMVIYTGRDLIIIDVAVAKRLLAAIELDHSHSKELYEHLQQVGALADYNALLEAVTKVEDSQVYYCLGDDE